MNGDLRITVNFTRDSSCRHARPPEPIEPIIMPLDITVNTDEAKIAAAAIAKITRALFDRGYLYSEGEAHTPIVKIEICDADEWITWHNPDGN